MRSIFILLAILLTACQQAGTGKQEPEQQKLLELGRQEVLRQSIQRFNEAFLSVDREALDSMTTANYLHTNGSFPPISKDIWLQFLDRRRQMIADSSLQIAAYEMDEMEIQFHDDAAWVSGLIRTKGLRDSVAFDDEIRVSHLWVWENGCWKRAAFQDAKRLPLE